MAEKVLDVADKSTLDIAKNFASDTNEKVTNLNYSIDALSQNIMGSSGSMSGYGNGTLGAITYDASTTEWPAKDIYGRYIFNCTTFVLPEGVTMIPPENCDGLYIYCTESCTINGTIDMREKRLTLENSNGISNFLEINGVKYDLAIGGHTVRGGDGGKGGKIVSAGSWGGVSLSPQWYTGGVASRIPYAGNVNGGGTSNYGYKGNSDGSTAGSGSNGGVSPFTPAPGAIVLASPSVTIGSTGVLNCIATEGQACENIGTDGVDAYISASGSSRKGTAGEGGNGTKAPTGGGCITVVTESFTNNGRMITNGSYISCVGDAVGATSYDSDSDTDSEGDTYSVKIYVTGGTAGEGGTYISQAGGIKIHIVGGAA